MGTSADAVVSWGDRARAWAGGPLADEQRRAFLRESAETDVRRLRVFLPIMLALHPLHVALFWANETLRATLPANLVAWRRDLVLAHAVTFALALAATVAVYRPRRERLRLARTLVPAVAVLYLLHGAVIAGIDQLSTPNASVFIGYSLGTAVVVCLPPLESLVVYAVGLGAFVAAIEAMQPSATSRLMVLPNGFSIVAVSLALMFLLFRGRRRDFAQRATIERQRAELREMNSGLERRVAEQVSEIVARAKEIELLNAQLQTQVRARSAELSMALAKLARERGEDGRLRKGLVLGDRFVVGELLGEGGMGSVYEGTDRSTEGRVAIKVIQASSAQQLDALHRFLREAGTAATVVHPAVVRMLHVDVSADGMLFQVQELVAGETLALRLAKDGPWLAERAARLGAVLCEALAAAHAQGVVHRDVKPSNIMVTRGAPGLKLLDFGISKLLPGRGRDASSGSGAVVGTPGYISPEQLSGEAKLTDRADVYAVGVLLFRMVTGAFPFDEMAVKEMILRRATGAPDVRALAPLLAPDLADLLAACLSIDPADRPGASDLSRALATFADVRGAPPLDAAIRDERSAATRPRSEESTVPLVPKRATPTTDEPTRR